MEQSPFSEAGSHSSDLEHPLSFHVEVFRVVTLCNAVVGYQRFTGSCCCFTLKMEAACACETLVSYHSTARRHNPGYLDFKHHRLESLKTHVHCSVRKSQPLNLSQG